MSDTKTMTAVFGGERIPVEYMVEAGNLPEGADAAQWLESPVQVRALPIRALQRYLEISGDDAAVVELYCDKPEGWADCLTVESVEAILEKGNELNFPAIQRLRERRADQAKSLIELLGAVKTGGENKPEATEKSE